MVHSCLLFKTTHYLSFNIAALKISVTMMLTLA
jgi:hypothetical protein